MICEFDRYVNGQKMAEGARITQAVSQDDALVRAVKMFEHDARPGEMARTEFVLTSVSYDDARTTKFCGYDFVLCADHRLRWRNEHDTSEHHWIDFSFPEPISQDASLMVVRDELFVLNAGWKRDYVVTYHEDDPPLLFHVRAEPR